jgi:hypothetical protein
MNPNDRHFGSMMGAAHECTSLGNQDKGSALQKTTSLKLLPEPRISCHGWKYDPASHVMKHALISAMHVALEMVSNIGPHVFWLNVRPKGSQPRIYGRSFSQSTSSANEFFMPYEFLSASVSSSVSSRR